MTSWPCSVRHVLLKEKNPRTTSRSAWTIPRRYWRSMKPADLERRPEIGGSFGAVHGNGRQDGQLPDRGVPDLCWRIRRGVGGPGTVLAQGMNARREATRAGRRARAGDVPDEAAAGRVHDRTLPSIATASQLGDTKGSPSKTVDAAHLTCERSGGQLMCYFLINAYPDRQYQTDSLILCVNLFQCHKMPCSIQGF